jgi:hypothetical protein
MHKSLLIVLSTATALAAAAAYAQAEPQPRDDMTRATVEQRTTAMFGRMDHQR